MCELLARKARCSPSGTAGYWILLVRTRCASPLSPNKRRLVASPPELHAITI
jgi:hypothetical protein